MRPAVNTGLSVSRVGGDAQRKIMKSVAGMLRLDMAQFRSLAAFAQFGSDLDKATQQQLDRGMRLQEILKQPQYRPTPLIEQVALIFAGTRGKIDHVPVPEVKEWEEEFLTYLRSNYANLNEQLAAAEYKLTDEIEATLLEAVDGFNQTWADLHETA